MNESKALLLCSFTLSLEMLSNNTSEKYNNDHHLLSTYARHLLSDLYTFSHLMNPCSHPVRSELGFPCADEETEPWKS